MYSSVTRQPPKRPYKGKGVMKEAKYKVGDVVQLKSGGPSMTVEGYRDYDGHVICQWFAGNKLQSGVFDPDSIGLEAELDPLTKLRKSGL